MHVTRLSQRYPPIARYGVFGVSTWPIGCNTPSPFSEPFPLGEHAKWRCDTPPLKKGVSQRYWREKPYESKANGCDTTLCDTISKGYCAIWGGYLRDSETTIKIKISLLRGGGLGGREENRPETLFFMGNATTIEFRKWEFYCREILLSWRRLLNDLHLTSFNSTAPNLEGKKTWAI